MNEVQTLETYKKELIYLITCMLGGGAERVMISLANDAVECGYDVTFILTGQCLSEAIGYSLAPTIKLLSLPDLTGKDVPKSIKNKLTYMYSRTVNSLAKRMKLSPPDSAIYYRFISEQAPKIDKLREIISEKPNATVIAFLDHSIHLALLSMSDLPNKLIISERGDPVKHDASKVASLFIKKYYDRADVLVLQTEGAKAYFSPSLQNKSVIIPNAIKEGLPERFVGIRKKRIINFCRISYQKNLPLLIEAFNIFFNKHPDYLLEIIGEAKGTEALQVVEACNRLIRAYKLEDCVSFKPFDPELHQTIIDYAMFVSSSDFEGMSNSMLEAMAIGLPCICTDCPSYGAREIIVDNENGILVQVGNKEQMAKAMCKVVENPDFANHLSAEACKITKKLDRKKIFSMWRKLY